MMAARLLITPFVLVLTFTVVHSASDLVTGDLQKEHLKRPSNAGSDESCLMFGDENTVSNEVQSQQVVKVGHKMTRLCKTNYTYEGGSVQKEFTCLADDLWDTNEVCKADEKDDRYLSYIATTAITAGTSAGDANLTVAGTYIMSLCVSPASTLCLLCLHGDGVVKLPTGHSKMVKDLQKGDEVLTVSADGAVEYRAVTAMVHRQPHQVATFVTLTTAGHHTIRLTPGHYLLTGRSVAEAKHVSAGDVVVGDKVLRHEDGQGLVVDTVVSKQYVTSRGIFAPLTPSGSIVVDSLLASVYVDGLLITPAMQHLLSWPLRTLGAPLADMVEGLGMPMWARDALLINGAFSSLLMRA